MASTARLPDPAEPAPDPVGQNSPALPEFCPDIEAALAELDEFVISRGGAVIF